VAHNVLSFVHCSFISVDRFTAKTTMRP